MKKLSDLKIETHKINCDFCGGDKFLPLFDTMRHGLNLPTEICENCALCLTNPQPTKDTLGSFYGEYYHLFHGRQSGVDKKYFEKSKRFAARRFDTLKKVGKLEGKKILEIGCGAGQFMQCLSDNKLDGTGIELGTESYEFCKSKNLNVINTSIEDFAPETKFDVIVSFHVLEHIRSPKEFMKKCHSLLNEGGLLYLEVPNLHKPGIVYPAFFQFPHLFTFSHTTLANYLRAAGFEIELVKDDLYALTVFGKKSTVFAHDFVKTDVPALIKRIYWVNKIQKIAWKLPSLPFFTKLKAILIQTSV